MKKVILAVVFLTLVACKKEASDEPFGKQEPSTETETTAEASSPEALGKQLFEGKGNCFSCHQVDQKVIGPSMKEIAQTYKDKGGDMVAFLKGEGEALVDPSQFEVMKTNFPVTKAMSDEELKALEAYFYSTLQ